MIAFVNFVILVNEQKKKKILILAEHVSRSNQMLTLLLNRNCRKNKIKKYYIIILFQ